MENNTNSLDRRSAPGPVAQQEINRLTVEVHMLTSALASTTESLAEAQARNVQLAAALKMVQGECGIWMGKVAKWEARDFLVVPDAGVRVEQDENAGFSDAEIQRMRGAIYCNNLAIRQLSDAGVIGKSTGPHFIADAVLRHIKSLATPAVPSDRAPNIDAIALAAATGITSACFAGVLGTKLTERVQALVAEAMRAGGGDKALLPAVLALDAAIYKVLIAGGDHGDELSDIHLRDTLKQAQHTAYRALISIGINKIPGSVNPLSAFLPTGEYPAPAVPIDRDKIGAKMPCGAVVTNVYEAYAAGKVATPREVPLPAGWKMVPIELTDAMVEAAGRSASGTWRPSDAGKAHNFWPVMLAAAPATPLPLPAGSSEQPAAVGDSQTGVALLSKGDVLQIFSDNAECSKNGDNHGYAVIYERHCLKIAEAFGVYTPAAPSAKPSEAK